jgi:type IX secretion system PorP/SprF family membrane protein
MKRISLVVLLFCGLCAGAQDLHFTQYFNAPLLVNPANAGFNPDQDYRIGGNYRTQWASLTANPYKTMSVWGDVQLFNDRFENGWVGAGGALMKDVAGAGELSATKAYASIAYHQMVGFNSLVSLGFNAGYVTKQVNFAKLTFDNSWNGKFFDVLAPKGENFLTNRQDYFDLQAGLNYAIFPSDNAYLNAGFSALHINRPKESFFATSQEKTTVSPRYTLFLNGVFKLDDRWILSPNVYVSKMATAWEYVAGGQANYNLSGDGATQLIGGLSYRVGDAVAPVIGFQLNEYKFTFNYDATMSALRSYNGTRGAFEVSLVKTGLFSEGKAIKCNIPSFN